MNKYKEAKKWIDEVNAHPEWARHDFEEPALSQLTELVEKATPKKYGTKTVKAKSFEDCEYNITHAICPTCGYIIDEFEYYAGCPYCLQAIDWSEEDV